MTTSGSVRIGVVGCGWVAERVHLPALRSIPTFDVVALADIDAQRMSQLAVRFGIARTYAEPVALFDDPTLDAVAICVPPLLHADAVIAALDAGKHVFVEKPLALSHADLERVVRRAASASHTTLVGFNLRHHRLIRKARDVVQAGTLGRLRLVRMTFCSGRDQMPNWRRNESSSGGIVSELGTHHFDVLRFITGSDIEDVRATRAGQSVGITGRLSCGVVFSSVLSEGTVDDNEIVFYGDEAVCRVNCYRADGFSMVSRGKPGAVRALAGSGASAARAIPRMIALAQHGGEYGASYRAQWRHFAACITGETQPVCTVSDAAKASYAAAAVLDSFTAPARG